MQHEFIWDRRLDYLRVVFEPPFERLGRYFDSDIQNPGIAQYVIDLFQSVLDQRVPHVSGNGNSWWYEVGPETARLGDIFVTPAFEIEVPTKDLVEMLAIYRDRKRAHILERERQRAK